MMFDESDGGGFLPSDISQYTERFLEEVSAFARIHGVPSEKSELQSLAQIPLVLGRICLSRRRDILLEMMNIGRIVENLEELNKVREPEKGKMMQGEITVSERRAEQFTAFREACAEGNTGKAVNALEGHFPESATDEEKASILLDLAADYTQANHGPSFQIPVGLTTLMDSIPVEARVMPDVQIAIAAFKIVEQEVGFISSEPAAQPIAQP